MSYVKTHPDNLCPQCNWLMSEEEKKVGLCERCQNARRNRDAWDEREEESRKRTFNHI